MLKTTYSICGQNKIITDLLRCRRRQSFTFLIGQYVLQTACWWSVLVKWGKRGKKRSLLKPQSVRSFRSTKPLSGKVWEFEQPASHDVLEASSVSKRRVRNMRRRCRRSSPLHSSFHASSLDGAVSMFPNSWGCVNESHIFSYLV